MWNSVLRNIIQLHFHKIGSARLTIFRNQVRCKKNAPPSLPDQTVRLYGPFPCPLCEIPVQDIDYLVAEPLCDIALENHRIDGSVHLRVER